MPINYTQVHGADIAEVVSLVEDTVEGYPNIIVSTACLVVAILAQNPDVEANKLQRMVMGLSEYMAANLFDDAVGGAVN